MKKKYRVDASKKIYTYVYLYQNIQFMKNIMELGEDKVFFSSMNIILSCAFCLEAYLNHIGDNIFDAWECENGDGEIPERFNPIDKLKYITDKIDLSIDRSRYPFQSFGEIFSFRTALVHGKTKIYSNDTIQKLSEKSDFVYPEPQWVKLCNFKDAQRAIADTEKMIKIIHVQAGFGEFPFVSAESGTASVDDIDVG